LKRTDKPEIIVYKEMHRGVCNGRRWRFTLISDFGFILLSEEQCCSKK